MTDSENSQPHDDSDDDIYKDIPEFNFEDELAKLEGTKETYKQEANDLSEKVKALTEENKELKKSNEVLKKNLSTLLKTAQAEVQRKDFMIEELRGKIDSFTFRRNKYATNDKYTGTDDLELNLEAECKLKKEKSGAHKKRSKSNENWTSSDSERKFNQEEKKKEWSSGKEENINCGSNNRKSGENPKNFRHSDNSHDNYKDKHRERKSTRFEDNSGYRRSYRENHRDHLKYDSFDKKRHSRSSESRFLSRRRNSREGRNDRRRSDSFDKRRNCESSERCRNSRKDKSRSRDKSRRSKESSLENPKNRSSFDKDLLKTKEQISFKSEVLDFVKNNIDFIENKRRIQCSEKGSIEEDEITTSSKSKQIKEKRSSKPEKKGNLEIFSSKSPLDALYKDMITSRSSNRFYNSKLETNGPESDLEEGELSVTQTINISESQEDDDWTLSFKNERQNEAKPMTLYSRRMMRKFSSEIKSTERVENIEKVSQEENKKKTEYKEVEREPGELTEDEHVVESSKEFQELTKVASIESELIEKPEKEKTFNEPIGRESYKMENVKFEPMVKESRIEIEKPMIGKEESSACKEIEPNIGLKEIIEFSPFKSNYKLIEISPVKRLDKEHVLDFYNRRIISTQDAKQNDPNLSEEKITPEKNPNKPFDTSEEKDSWGNSSSEKVSETELKIIIPSGSESPKKQEKQTKEKKGTRMKKEVKKSKTSKEDYSKKKKQKSVSRKEIEKLVFEDKCQKRKRKLSDTREEISNPKKRKTEKTEPSRKNTRSKRNSKSEPENKSKPESETKSVPKLEQDKIKEDISSFEFFKPVVKPDAKIENQITFVDADKSVCTTTDYKMMATMSVSGVVRLETPNKCVEKLKNIIINEQMIFNILDSKNNSQFSPLIGSKCIEMTPRRMLKNDLMLTDSEDDSINKKNMERVESEEEQKEVKEEEGDEMSGSENSECDSDSGASDFVDLL